MPGHAVLESVIIVFVGLVLGSFATALSWRVARNISWTGGRSQCPSCQAALGFPDLVPLFSWLALKGRCRHCKAPIPVRYPLIELAVLAGCLGVYAAWGFTASAFIIMAALPFLAAMLVIDIEQMILPDSLQTILAGLGLLFVGMQAFTGAAARLGQAPIIFIFFHLCSAVFFAGAIWVAAKAVSILKKKDALGFGDVKFFAVAGLWLGVLWLPCFMIIAGLMGMVCGLVWRLRREDRRFPFGPALILAFYACLLLQGRGFSPFFAL